MTLTCHSRSDPRSERVAHSVARVSLAVSGETNDNGGVYKTPVSLANPLASFDPETMVRCADYHAHQTSHHRDGNGWTCDICNLEVNDAFDGPDAARAADRDATAAVLQVGGHGRVTARIGMSALLPGVGWGTHRGARPLRKTAPSLRVRTAGVSHFSCSVRPAR